MIFQLDRLVYATVRPDEIDQLVRERGLQPAAPDEQQNGLLSRLYGLPGGGMLEVISVADETAAKATEAGRAFCQSLQETGDRYTALYLETDHIDRVHGILKAEGYPVYEFAVYDRKNATGQAESYRLLRTFDHLPVFIQYDRPKTYQTGYPQAAFLRTVTLEADTTLMEQLMERNAVRLSFSDRNASVLPLTNATLRLESAEAYGFAFFDPHGVWFE